MAKIKAQVISSGPINPEPKMRMSLQALEEACEALTPWNQDTRTAVEKDQDEEKSLENFYYRNIEAYKENQKLIEEIENGPNE